MKINYSIRALFSILIGASLIHNAEEALTICNQVIKSPVSFLEPLGCNQFLWAVTILSILEVVFFVYAITTKKPAVFLFISTAISTALLFNVIIPHLFLAIYTIHYTPGLITAILLILPLSIAVLSKNRSEINNKLMFRKYTLIGLGIGYLLFAFIMILVKVFV
jgi:hypothetical protein